MMVTMIMGVRPFATFLSGVIGKAGVIGCFVVASSLSAQTRDPAVQAMSQEWRTIVANISKSAEMMPDSNFKFRPVTTVMTFGELIAHVSYTQYSICSSTLRAPMPADSMAASGSGKADLRRHLDASIAFCRQAYDQNLAAMTDNPREQSRRYFGLAHNTAHVNEHYGNMVTYLRILGFVPPSSAR